jgi:hypothetical protein
MCVHTDTICVCPNSVSQTFIEFALLDFNANVQNKYLYSMLITMKCIYAKKLCMRSFLKRIVESKLDRQQRGFHFLELPLRKGYPLSRFSVEKILKVHILMLKSTD